VNAEIILDEQRPYQPFGGAEELFYCKSKEILIEGPAGTGKTRGVLEKVHLCACKYPGIRVLLIRKTRRALTESVLVTYEEKVLPANDIIKHGPQREHRHSYKYPNGSVIVIGGMDNPDRIMSTEYDIIAAFESHELSEDDWEKATTRLRNGKMPYQQAIADTNPAAPTHWLNQRASANKMQRILSRHKDNPSVTDEYLRTLDQLTGARRARLRDGRWASQEGLVYEFDPQVHMKTLKDLPENWDQWNKYRVIDFGYTNPFVCQWWVQDPDDRLYMYREIYYSHRLVREHAEQIKELSVGERYVVTLSDHDAEDRATLHDAGIYTQPAPKEVATGIQAVQLRLKIRPDGKPGLFVIHDALVERDPFLVNAKKPVCTREEYDSYSWPKAADGRQIKEAPVKVDDHGMDCTKYLCLYLTKPKRTAPKVSVH
jgi:phage terminase large subunit